MLWILKKLLGSNNIANIKLHSENRQDHIRKCAFPLPTDTIKYAPYTFQQHHCVKVHKHPLWLSPRPPQFMFFAPLGRHPGYSHKCCNTLLPFTIFLNWIGPPHFRLWINYHPSLQWKVINWSQQMSCRRLKSVLQQQNSVQVVHDSQRGSILSDSQRGSWPSQKIKNQYLTHILGNKRETRWTSQMLLSEEMCTLSFPGEVGVRFNPTPLHDSNELQS